MQKRRRIQADDWLALALVGLLTGWAWFHFLSVKSDPMQDAQAWLLIEPLTWAVTIVAGLIAATIAGSVFRSRKRGRRGAGGDAEAQASASRRTTSTQYLYLASLPVFYVALETLGYTITTAFYVVVMSLCLGERRWLAVTVLVAIVLLVVRVGAAELLSVPLPLMPEIANG